ncbi:LamG-like jellyroll fold domain-containing protein, partial [Paenibacillus tyrfis]|uniref:LamG-like jellyroll fold domain-containing protein n=1 Tax=Paenibacillus tyrfis TaxID=1501230 RepID=UPI00056A3DD8
GLVGYWKLDEVSRNIAYDSTSNKNHGTLYGKGMAYLTLDGQDDYGVLSKSGMIPTGGSNYTVELWFKKDTFDKGYREMLSQWTKENISNSFYLGMDNGNMRFTDSWNSVPIGELRTDTWYHLAAVSTPNNAYLYINGELKATKGTALTYTGNGPLVL